MLQIQDNLFIKSMQEAFNSLKKRFSFWLMLTLNVFLTTFLGVLVLAFGFGFVVAKSQLLEGVTFSAITMPQLLVHLKDLLLQHKDVLLLLVLLGIVALYFMTVLSFVAITNSYDAASGKKPRGFVWTKNVFKFIPLFIVMSIHTQFSYYSGSYIAYILLLFLSMFVQWYIVFARLYLSTYSFVDKQDGLFMVLKKSWSLTKNHVCSVVLFMLFGYAWYSYMFLSIMIPLLSILKAISNFVIYPYYFLVCAHFYQNLKLSKNKK